MGKKTEVVDEVVDEAEAKAARKAAKRAAKEAAAAAEVEPEVDEAEAKRLRKAAKKAAAAAAAEAEAEPEVDEEEAKRQRKAAKKAAKLAAAEAEAEAEAPKKAKKAKRAAEDDEEEEAAPPAKKVKSEAPPAGNGAAAEGNSFKAFIKGLPYSVDEAALRKDFEECGEITLLQFPYNEEGKPKGFAFITYATQEGFDAALKFDNTQYSGRYINVLKADGGGGKGKDGKGKGKGKAEDWICPNPECGDNVFARNSECRKCGTANPNGGGGGTGPPPKDNVNTVFVRGLPWSVDEIALKKDFGECGEIERLVMPLNEEGRPKGIAFIKYATPEGVEAALKFDETDYGGRTVNVSKAEDRSGGKGKDGKGKDGKDGKGKGKDKGKDKGKGKGKKSKAPSQAQARGTGCLVESTGAKKTFEDSDDE